MFFHILSLLRAKLPCTENFEKYKQDFIEKMGDKITIKGGKKIAGAKVLRSVSPTGSPRGGSPREDGSTTSGSSLLSKAVNIDKFTTRKEERKKRAANQEAVAIGMNPESPSMKGGDFIRLANQKTASGANQFASPSHILNPGVERTGGEEEKKESI